MTLTLEASTGRLPAEQVMKIDQHLELGHCGMGMPVIRAWQALRELPVGGILQLSSSHPCAVPDIIAWCKRSGQELLSIVADDQARQFYIQRVK